MVFFGRITYMQCQTSLPASNHPTPSSSSSSSSKFIFKPRYQPPAAGNFVFKPRYQPPAAGNFIIKPEQQRPAPETAPTLRQRGNGDAQVPASSRVLAAHRRLMAVELGKMGRGE
ncbi:hypothetical protein BS50DRAFT_675233 [Corynespora cassiicola Philippines]|uniref:Uncharacterized protein n=1 Tax=Corynespora cassiicola Philippines TaxID=1448308 RepID=A0A2T2NU78_CORCC|nr:hypothetical protein BS50DRAFT_675233 [Corynespora cassiicola Philippines]